VDLNGVRWRTSSFSNSDDGNNCVEVAFLPDSEVAVRDTKSRSRAPHVHGAAAWGAFLAAVRAGEFGPRSVGASPPPASARRSAAGGTA
jgi:hypothetical protein